MKKPKLLNKFDKSIKAEIDTAEKLRKKVSSEGAGACAAEGPPRAQPPPAADGVDACVLRASWRRL